MDPTQLLKEIRELTKDILLMSGLDYENAAIELADKIDNLDNWISKGGFLPEDWRSND